MKLALPLLAAVVPLLIPNLVAATRPNVVLILADDLGYETIGANGGTSYRTPVLDKLAAAGVRFEHCYVQPLCTPTRVQLMTGIYNVRNYINFGNLDGQATTFGNLFQRAGYATCITGKWQLGREPELPKQFGFDEYCLWQHLRRPERYRNPGLEINGVMKDWTNGEYGPDIVNEYALDFITRHRDRPFFLYYPMMLTHAPYGPTPDSADFHDPPPREERGTAGEPPHFAAMVAYMDKLVGRLVARLEALNLRDNTLVIFTGDNGTGRGTVSRMGERKVIGGKGQTTSAGMRVPLIVSWPAQTRGAPGTVRQNGGGRVVADLVDSTDFLPTICEAAGIAVPAELRIDGRSFLPQVRGERGQPRDWVYCWYSREGVLAEARECAFDQRFKLYRTGEFFDLRADVNEQNPLTVGSLGGEAEAAAKKLGAVLERFREARPAHLVKLARPARSGTRE